MLLLIKPHGINVCDLTIILKYNRYKCNKKWIEMYINAFESYVYESIMKWLTYINWDWSFVVNFKLFSLMKCRQSFTL